MYHARVRYIIFSFVFFLIAVPVFAQREPVLKQIDLPHPYYYREIYLPQLTTGPSAVTWSPDSKEVIYSMQGSLWRQAIDSTNAVQLTDGPGYDYQPDWSSNGNEVVFANYDHDAVQIYLLNLNTGATHALTTGADVNVEPRWSPDGKRVAFVSTHGTGHFHIFTVAVENGHPGQLKMITKQNKSDLPRYYYSAYDHEISPTWSPDGKEIIYISNRNHIHGTGGFWRMKIGSEPKEIHYEETTWKARPDWSPDGKRIVYSSYLGRNWHQMWIMTSDGGDTFPLSYGEFDNTGARWSHDGSKIAFISNRDGNTSLWIQTAVGGGQTKVESTNRKYKRPMAQLNLTIADAQGKPVPARVSITGEDGRAYAPDDGWMQADDSYDRSERPFEAHYFESTGKAIITVPPGKIQVDVLKGFDRTFEQRTVSLKAGEMRNLLVTLRPLALLPTWSNWISNDVHVHMNYTGTYRNQPDHMIMQASAEGLNVVHNLIVNKEQRFPDIAYFTPIPKLAGRQELFESQEYHTSYWGHLGILGLTDHVIIPGYAAYPNTPASSLYPTNGVVADLAHAQKALAGYVHPFDSEPDPFKDASLSERELPADVALGKIDYYEVMGFSDHKATSAVWYRLLNCGFHLPAAAGTDAMSNYASLRGPVGLNRVYVDSHGSLKREDILAAIKTGKTFVTNAPLLSFSVNGKAIGSELQLPAGAKTVTFTASLRSIVPVDHLQVIHNGKVVKEIELKGDRKSADEKGTIPIEGSGWLVLRAWSEKAIYPVLDAYPFASTGPVYLTVDDSKMHSREDAAYFIKWLDRVIQEATAHKGYNNDAEKEVVLKTLTDARSIYEKLQ